jgi:hypothetical protein
MYLQIDPFTETPAETAARLARNEVARQRERERRASLTPEERAIEDAEPDPDAHDDCEW